MGATAGCPRYRIPRERCPLCRVPATFRCIRFRERRVAVALFRERALLHCMACCADSVSPLPCSAKMRYCIAQPYCAANRDVILSRRACGVSKNLLRLPQSDYNATMPMLRPPLSFRPKRGVKRRAERRNLSHCTHAFAMIIDSHSYTLTLLQPREILRLRASLFARHSAQDDRRPAGVSRSKVPRMDIIALHNIIPRTAGV